MIMMYLVVEVNESWLLGRAIYKSLEQQERRLENPFECTARRVCEFVWFLHFFFLDIVRNDESERGNQRKENSSRRVDTHQVLPALRSGYLIVRSKRRIINHDTTKIEICLLLNI